MIESSRLTESFLQHYRFKMVKPYLIDDVLDFGGNEGELRRLVKGKYLVVNYDHAPLDNAHADTIVCLAVIEHMVVPEVSDIFRRFKTILNEGGRIFLTTPARASKPILEFLALAGILDKQNIAEHKHYWSKEELYALAEKQGFVVKTYRRFQIGFNQLAVFEHKSSG